MFCLVKVPREISPKNRLKNCLSILKVWVGKVNIQKVKRVASKVSLRHPPPTVVGANLPRWRRSVWSCIYGSTGLVFGINRCRRWSIFWTTIFILRSWNKSRPVRFREFWGWSKIWEKCSQGNLGLKKFGARGRQFLLESPPTWRGHSAWGLRASAFAGRQRVVSAQRVVAICFPREGVISTFQLNHGGGLGVSPSSKSTGRGFRPRPFFFSSLNLLPPIKLFQQPAS